MSTLPFGNQFEATLQPQPQAKLGETSPLYGSFALWFTLAPKFLRQETRHKSVQSCGIPNDRQTGNVSTGKRSLKNHASLGTD